MRNTGAPTIRFSRLLVHDSWLGLPSGFGTCLCAPQALTITSYVPAVLLAWPNAVYQELALVHTAALCWVLA